MRKLTTKYYNNVYVILDPNRKKKLQELLLRSIKNDLNKWRKVVRFDKEKGTTDTDYFSPSYSGYVFQFDYDKMIGLAESNIFELVFDPMDYKRSQYPEEIAKIFRLLIENIFTDGVKQLDNLVPKSQTEIAEDKRNERSSKLNELWGEKENE